MTTGRQRLYDRQLVSDGNPMEAVVGFSRAVRVGRSIAVGGTAPVDVEGRTVGLGDVAAQTRRCFEIVRWALAQAGAGMDDVVRTRLLLTDIEDWRAAVKVRAEFCGEARPADTIVQVGRFVNPEWLIEVEVDAVIADSR
ncbi:RidA family protein [uncultured Limimaricola sp.]|uniref:RidA family protein n=1 Tax=uncultured Limimaricola sp. TaxID=2211667 RepID=UPI0030F7DB8F